MKKYFLFAFVIFFATTSRAQIYLASSCDISFFSKSVIENIAATNNASKPVLNSSSGEVLIKVPVRSFKFKSQLMQEHFNEDYMESEKFPFAIYKGKIKDTLDYSKDTTWHVSVTGTMNMHGVEKTLETDGTISISKGNVTLDSKFIIRIADYNIKVPSLYVQNIAEDLEIKIHSVLEPYKKD